MPRRPISADLIARMDGITQSLTQLADQTRQVAELAIAHDKAIKEQQVITKDLHDALELLIQRMASGGAPAPPGNGTHLPPGMAPAQMEAVQGVPTPAPGPAVHPPDTVTPDQASAASAILSLARQFFPGQPTPADQMATLGVELLKGMVDKMREETSLSSMLTKAIAQRIAQPVADQIAGQFE
jgi:hypothetical protein